MQADSSQVFLAGHTDDLVSGREFAHDVRGCHRHRQHDPRRPEVPGNFAGRPGG